MFFLCESVCIGVRRCVSMYGVCVSVCEYVSVYVCVRGACDKHVEVQTPLT